MSKGTPVWIASALVLGAGLAFASGPVGSAVARAQTGGTSGAEAVGETTGSESRLSMERILATVKAAGYSAVSRVEREHGRYEVKARAKQGYTVEIFLDPETGELLKDPETGKPLEKRLAASGTGAVEPRLSFEDVVAQVKAEGYPEVYSIEYEHALFEIKARDTEGRKVELYVHPKTGKLLRHPKTGKPLKESIDE